MFSDELMVAKWKINGVKNIIQKFQAGATDSESDIFFVLSEELKQAMELLEQVGDSEK